MNLSSMASPLPVGSDRPHCISQLSYLSLLLDHLIDHDLDQMSCLRFCRHASHQAKPREGPTTVKHHAVPDASGSASPGEIMSIYRTEPNELCSCLALPPFVLSGPVLTFRVLYGWHSVVDQLFRCPCVSVYTRSS